MYSINKGDGKVVHNGHASVVVMVILNKCSGETNALGYQNPGNVRQNINKIFHKLLVTL